MKAALKYYLSVFLRRLPWFLIPAVAISAIGIIVAMTLPPTYTSRARFVVESPQIPNELAPPSSTGSTTERLQIIQQRLMSRANLLDVARQQSALPGMGNMSPDQIYDAMVAQTTFRISGGGRTGQPLQAQVSFDASNAQTAAGNRCGSTAPVGLRSIMSNATISAMMANTATSTQPETYPPISEPTTTPKRIHGTQRRISARSIAPRR